ncbi:MAG: HAD-IA family hydrolase [Clostridia bacterium]|nr:HAD-IA family hydrolase [Clostridia bacterium]
MKLIRPEDIIVEKLEALIGIIIAKLIEPDMKFKNVLEIDEHRIKDFKENYGIEGIILDVDETLRNKTDKIPECNKQWINLMKKHFKVIIVSNGKSKMLAEYFSSIGIDYIFFAHKPAKNGFNKACKSIGVRPEKIIVIGNSLFDDIYGAQRSKMKGALIKEVQEDGDENR